MIINWKDNIKNYLLEIFNFSDDKCLYSILIWKPIVYYFWDEFAEDFMKWRVSKNISLKSLRVTKNNFDILKHKNYLWYNKEVKHIESDLFSQNIFLFWLRVFIFDMNKFELVITDDKAKYNYYLNNLNDLWNQ